MVPSGPSLWACAPLCDALLCMSAGHGNLKMGVFCSGHDNGWELAFDLFLPIRQVPGLSGKSKLLCQGGLCVEDAWKLTNRNCGQAATQTEISPCVTITLLLASGIWQWPRLCASWVVFKSPKEIRKAHIRVCLQWDFRQELLGAGNLPWT